MENSQQEEKGSLLNNVHKTTLEKCKIPIRYMLAVVVMFGVLFVFTIRVVLSVVIIRLTPSNQDQFNTNTEEFQWNSSTQGYILGSFYIGYAVSQIPINLISHKFESTRLFGYAILIIALCSILTPFIAVTCDFYGIIALRMFQGLADGFTFPCIIVFWSKWSPEDERSFLTSTSMAGMYFGILLAMSATEYIMKWCGWKSVFYIYGACGIIWYILWTFVSSETPENHQYITEKEKNYIIQSRNMKLKTNKLKIPWKSIFTSLPFYAVTIGIFCQDWGAFLLMAVQPTYLNKTLKYTLSESGIYSGIPYIFQPFIMTFGGSIADLLYKRKYMSLTLIRKCTVTMALFGQLTFLLASLQFTDSKTRLILLSLSLAFSGLTYSGLMPNIIDISPIFSGATMAVSNSLSAFSGIISVFIAGKITSTESIEEWDVVLYLTAVVYLTGIIFYGLFSSADVQPWNTDI